MAAAAQQAAIAIAKKKKLVGKKARPQERKCRKKFPGDYNKDGKINAADFKKHRKDCKRG